MMLHWILMIIGIFWCSGLWRPFLPFLPLLAFFGLCWPWMNFFKQRPAFGDKNQTNWAILNNQMSKPISESIYSTVILKAVFYVFWVWGQFYLRKHCSICTKTFHKMKLKNTYLFFLNLILNFQQQKQEPLLCFLLYFLVKLSNIALKNYHEIGNYV